MPFLCRGFGTWPGTEPVGNPDLSCKGEGAGWLLVGSFVPIGLRTRGTLGSCCCPPAPLQLPLPPVLGGHSPGPAATEGPGTVSQQQARWCCSLSAYVNADLSTDSSLGWIKPCMIAALVHFQTLLIYIWIPMGALRMSRARTILGRRDRLELARSFVPLLVTQRKECTHHFNI